MQIQILRCLGRIAFVVQITAQRVPVVDAVIQSPQLRQSRREDHIRFKYTGAAAEHVGEDIVLKAIDMLFL